MKKIAIIGAGQLGSRHLQGIAKSSFEISIEVIEPNENSRQIAQQRYNEIPHNKFVSAIKFYDSISYLSEEIDLVIIATNSDIRSKVVQELLETKKVHNLVLEKVLFQKVEDYFLVKKLLMEKNIKCWVNHPMRMFPGYIFLKEKLKHAKQISYNYQGGDWGLGCNALHYIDHLMYLGNSNEIEISNQFLNNVIYNSKRNNFIEFNGLLTGKVGNNVFSLFSHEKSTKSIFTILSDELIAHIDETAGIMTIGLKENNFEFELCQEKVICFQSDLSAVLIEDILINSKCLLPEYDVAMNLHISFINSLLEHMNKINGLDNKLCPIT